MQWGGWPTTTQAKAECGFHLGVGQQPQLLELVGGQEVGLVHNHHHPDVATADTACRLPLTEACRFTPGWEGQLEELSHRVIPLERMV